MGRLGRVYASPSLSRRGAVVAERGAARGAAGIIRAARRTSKIIVSATPRKRYRSEKNGDAARVSHDLAPPRIRSVHALLFPCRSPFPAAASPFPQALFPRPAVPTSRISSIARCPPDNIVDPPASIVPTFGPAVLPSWTFCLLLCRAADGVTNAGEEERRCGGGTRGEPHRCTGACVWRTSDDVASK